MKNIILLTIFSFTAALSWSSCEIINPEEKIPTYVRIDSFSFTPTPNTGTSSHKISVVWAYFEGRTLGVFDLPATIPVLSDAPGQLLVTPGVVYSGLNDLLVPYPHYVSDTMTLTPAPGQIINFTPNTRYRNEDQLNIINEDFELGNSFTLIYGDTNFVRVNEPGLVFEGDWAGYIHFNNHKFAEYVMASDFTAVTSGSFLELDYRGSLPFDVGLASTNESGQFFNQYLFTYKPRETWNKVYVGLQDFISAYPNKAYRVMIRVRSDTPVQGYVSLDNIKVVTIK